MTIKPLAADYWYRCSDDPDHGLRSIPQMGAGHHSEGEALAMVARLREQGYTVQRVTLADTCLVCEGAGRIGTAPKGTRKVKIASLPAWRLTWTACKACQGEGVTGLRDLAIR